MTALNFIDYPVALDIQSKLWSGERSDDVSLIGEGPIRFLCFESPAIWTVGRGIRSDDIFKLYPQLRAVQHRVLPVNRGGHVTYHGPGQVVLFPVPALNLTAQERRQLVGRGPRVWVDDLQDRGIRAAQWFGVHLHSRREFPGLWEDGFRKVASIGLRFSQVSAQLSHGMSVNVDARVHAGFARIDPCGLSGVCAVGLSSVAGRNIPAEDFLRAWVDVDAVTVTASVP